MEMGEHLPSLGQLFMLAVVLFIPLYGITASLIDQIRQLSVPFCVKICCLFVATLICLIIAELL